MSILDSNQLSLIRQELRSSKESVEKKTPDQMTTFKEHAEPARKKDYDPSHITRDGISSMYESIKTVSEKHPTQDPTEIFGQDLNEEKTDQYATAIRSHSDHAQKKKGVSEGLFDGDPQEAPVSRKEFFKVLSTSLASLGGGGVGMNDVTAYVDERVQYAFEVDLGNTYVDVAGDSMTGGLLIDVPASSPDDALTVNTRSNSTIKIGQYDTRYPLDIAMSTNAQNAWGATVRFATDFKVKKDTNNIDGSNLLDVQRANASVVVDGKIKTKTLEHFSGVNNQIGLYSGIVDQVQNKFDGSNYSKMGRRVFYNGIPYIDGPTVGTTNNWSATNYDNDHPAVFKEWRSKVQYVEVKRNRNNISYMLREILDTVNEPNGPSGGVQRIRYLFDPEWSRDAVPLKYVNSRSSRLQPEYIGDSAQRAIVQSGFSTPLDSSDGTGHVGTMFVNTSGGRPRLQFWRDSAWQDLRSRFDSGEVLGIVNSLRYTTADHDSDTLAQVDSAYVQARVGFPADTIIDSDDVVGIVDSDYVQARVTFPADLVGLDSEAVINLFDSDYINIRVDNPFDQTLNTTDIVTFDQVYANLDGALEFKANNRSGGIILKGQPVYIDGVDGNKPTVALADANDPNKMPAYGLALEDANDNADIIIVTFGSLKDVDTSAFDIGDTLYIGTTPGTLVNTPPAGTSAKIQNIGRVIKSHGSSGSIKVGGAGRTNATPNLDAGEIFYGNDSDRSEAVALTSVVDSDYVQTRINAAALDFSSVPTSDPNVAGLVWRDSDTMRISLG